MRLTAVISLPLLALLASACGGGDSDLGGDPEAEIERDVKAFAEAVSDGEMARAYSYLSEECKESISLSQFMGSMMLANVFLGEDWEIEITDVEVVERDGDRAVVNTTAQFKVEGQPLDSENVEDDGPQTLVREDGKWRIADCEDLGGDFQPYGDGPTFGDDDGDQEPVELTTVAVGESFGVAAEDLGELFGEDGQTGFISVRVTAAEIASNIESEFYGQQNAKGKFVIVRYEVVSDLNRRMQPSIQINDELVLMDERDRQWEVADYQGDYFGISGDAARAAGCDEPEEWIGAGFTGCTAAVFDVPTDAQGFRLTWKKAGVSIPLDMLDR